MPDGDIARLPMLRGKTTMTGWQIPDDMSVEEWKAAGATLGRIERAVMWWIGDWWAFGEHRYGDRKAIVEAPDWTGPSFGTCANAATVCRRFETSCRHEVLSFEHHRLVVSLPAPEADRLLIAAKPATDSKKPQLSTSELRGEVKRIHRAQRIVDLADETERAAVSLGGKAYNVIYADPPWRFEPYSHQTGMDRAADNHYPTMTLEAIRDLAVPAAPDCVLFLWATVPMLSEALVVMDAWGFKYKSNFAWVKDKTGTGYWNRNRHELLLLGTRGDIPAPAPGEQYSSVIDANVGKHSEKPAAFAEMIDDMFPGLAAIELFARGPRLGWDVWGNE